MKNVAIVVPTIREDCIMSFIEAWAPHFQHSTLVIVEDNPTRSFRLEGANVLHFAWDDIDRDLASRAWIIPRRTDCIRSYGFFKAWQLGAEIIISLDDDCYPTGPDFVDTHVYKLTEVHNCDAWVSTLDGSQPRGIPYLTRTRQVLPAINHGLWLGIPDYDAITQLALVRLKASYDIKEMVIPRGLFFPMCGMNVAFRREITPAMYFLLMGRDWPFDRFGDIWCGILAKKICDHLNYCVCSGNPLVEHRRASNVWANLRKEVAGYEANERFWTIVDKIVLTTTSVSDCYAEIAHAIKEEGEYWRTLGEAMILWISLFQS